ncbi:MAG TPA: hypothetical protein VGX68_03700 [Thermoanaerobaculia bacterium]|jgi:hypothetical protein|nr:hypothetical protein [Thermoanaerobaculia bacterium]
MARFVVRCLLLSTLAASGVAHAGTVYVPAPGITTLGGSTYEVQVSMTNTAAAARDVKQTSLADDTDGTQRSGTPGTVQVQAGRSAVVKAAGTFRGLVELSGSGELRYTARLVGTGPGRLGVYLPVITSDNLLKGGQTVALQGLLSGSGRAADLELVNLAQQAAQCTVSLTRADGTALGTPATFPLKPLSSRYIPDIFTGTTASEVRAAVSCTREFFTFALLSDAATGELTYVGPGGSGESLLRLPGEAPGCPATAICFDAKGIVHAPTSAANAEKGVNFLPAAGTYSKLRLTMDVTAGPWWTQNPDALHMLFWLVKDRNYNMFGYASFRGPDKNEAILRHGIALTHAQKAKIVQPITVVEGKVYHLDYTYDTALQVVDLAISDGSGAVVHLTGPPNVANFTFNGKEKIVVGIGFPGTNPDEAPTFGWVYRDLHLELSK